MDFFLSKTKSNIVATTGLLLKELQIPFNWPNLRQTLEGHPYFPSILAISDVLNEWQIQNHTYAINKDRYEKNDFLFPFIAHLNANGGQFILVHNISNRNITYSNENDKSHNILEEDFLKQWTGIVLHATKTDKSGDPEYKQNQIFNFINSSKIPALIFITAIIILSIVNYKTASNDYLILLLLKLFGFAVTALLLMYSIDSNKPLVKQLCNLGGNNNCNAILTSKAANITKWLSWSEVGLFYFTSTFATLLVVPSSFPIIVWLNVLALPYTAYSINYQYRNKNWCLLCCTVQGILISEGLVSLLTYLIKLRNPYSFEGVNLNAFVTLALTFFITFFLWNILKPLLLKAKQISPLKMQLNKFKYNSDLFNHMLTNQTCYNTPDELIPIVLGNPDAENTITMVSNPFCGPCARAHQVLEKLINNSDQIKVKIILTSTNNYEDARTKIAGHLTSLSLSSGRETSSKALKDWYIKNYTKYEDWAIKYPVNNIDDKIYEITEKQIKWCELVNVKHTPTFLVNGYKLIDPYTLEDLKYLLS